MRAASISTRDTLIDTATELFLGRGFGLVGTNELCAASGINKGTFYHFFPSKSALMVAAIDRYSERFAAEFNDIALSGAPASTRLERFFDVPAKANRAWKSTHGFAQGCLIGNISLELAVVDPDVQHAIKRAIARWSMPIGHVINALVAEGTLQDIDRAAAAEIVIALMQGGILLAKVHNDPSRITILAPGALSHLRALASSRPPAS
ncbi:TetR/AcrR family transcriptional regulator [Acidiphilium sp. C61]|jgi:TetR/AcrR family transcriptional repressor of nem operon|uniref:TetR/AcrR family transcriptional regulator n=1 Tax=Acidiphilium sp. C61 TaxID=1671485 RepID=UPI00157ABAF6|nr:TetR/AcrR family transcriptional regulator [Acidiphilium sp. C61]